MVKAPGAAELQPLNGHGGNIVDQLLGVASDSEPGLAEPLRKIRLLMRTVRPEDDFGWSAEMHEQLVKHSAEANHDRTRRAIADAIQVAEGTKSSLDVQDAWSLPNAPPLDIALELTHFRTTESIDSVEKKFLAHIDGDDVWGVVLRGHLWIEIVMNGLIERALVHAEAIADARLSFSQKVSLARGLNQLSEVEVSVIRRLNKLRNRLAHNIDAEVSESDQAELVNLYAADPAVAEMVKRSRPLPEGLTIVIVVLFVRMNARADQFDAQKRYDNYMHQRVLKLLGDRHPEASSRRGNRDDAVAENPHSDGDTLTTDQANKA